MTQGTIDIGREMQTVNQALEAALDELPVLIARIERLRARRETMVSLFQQASAPERTDGEEPPQ